LQADVFDPVTIRHLETIVVADGWNCLEVGAGTGSIAQWLSQRVGPTGKVVATDIDMRFLSLIAAPNLEIRQHNILKDDLEVGHYDLVHCRKLLEHLPEPEKALSKMADAVRPGGWLLIEEDDLGSHLSMDVMDPSLAPIAAAFRASFDNMRKKGISDAYFGRRVRGLVEGIGFVDVGQEGWTCMFHVGDPLERVYEMMWPTSVASGLFTQEQVESIRRMSQDPTIYWPGYTLFSAWGRKPSVVE
jgi:SAM-dependent methyltransferase